MADFLSGLINAGVGAETGIAQGQLDADKINQARAFQNMTLARQAASEKNSELKTLISAAAIQGRIPIDRAKVMLEALDKGVTLDLPPEVTVPTAPPPDQPGAPPMAPEVPQAAPQAPAPPQQAPGMPAMRSQAPAMPVTPQQAPTATIDVNSPEYKARQQRGAKQANIGNELTTFVPGMGYYNPETKQWQPDVPVSQKPGTVGAAGKMDPILRQQFNQYQKDVAPYTKQAVNFVNAFSSLGEAKAKNPQAYSSLLANFIRTVDANPQMRLQMLMYFKNTLGASAPNNLEIAAQRITEGSYPPEVLAGIEQHMHTMATATKNQINQIRSFYVKSYPPLDQYVPAAETYFGGNLTGAPAAGAMNPRDAARAKLGLPPTP